MFRLFRGVLLVVIGIVIGVIVLASTLEEADDEPQASGGTTTTTAASDTAPTTIPTQTTAQADPATPPAAPTTAAPSTIPDPTILPPGEVKVQVFNGTDTQGAAGRLTTTLVSRNYTTSTPQNAPDTGQYATSSIYYTESRYLGNAYEVADLLGVTNLGAIQLLPADFSPVDLDEEANVIVIIGEDGLTS